ncbi:hypothetical protein AY600_20115 [Phormidium willei BDU 130791]|nr:hypothetical protein AY600_20115 [Phormidium willei BDU 130791]
MNLNQAKPLVCLVSYDELLAERIAIVLDPAFDLERSRPEAEAMAAVAESTQPDLWLVDLDEAGPAGSASVELLPRVQEVALERPVVAISADFSGSQVLAAMRAGASDFLDKTGIDETLIGQLQRWIDGRRGQAARRGNLLATLGMLPGTGVTALAEGLAGELAAAEPEQRVLLIDLTSGRALSQMLESGQKPYTLDDALGDIGRLDDSLIETAFARAHAERVFLLERDPERATAQAWHDYDFMTLLSVLRRWFAWTVVAAHYDFGGGVFRRLHREAEEVVLACDQRLGNVQALAGYLNSLGAEGTPAGRAHFVVTRANKRLSPSPQQLVEKFDFPSALVFPDARLELETAGNAGLPISSYAPRCDYVGRLRELARRVRALDAGKVGAPRLTAGGSGLVARLMRSLP